MRAYLRVEAAKARLLLRQRAARKDRLEVHPLALHLFGSNGEGGGQMQRITWSKNRC